MRFFKPPTPANPLVVPSWSQYFNERACRINGCVTYGSYYAFLPQASCRRCGKRTVHAAKHIKEWEVPDSQVAKLKLVGE